MNRHEITWRLDQNAQRAARRRKTLATVFGVAVVAALVLFSSLQAQI